MIIDCNVHITENGSWFNSALDASALALLKQMDEGGIDKALVVPFAGFISNDFVFEVCRNNPGRLISAASINPAASLSDTDAEREFTAMVNRSNFSVIKFHNRLHQYSPMDDRLMAMLQANEKLAKSKVIMICGLFYSKHVPHFSLTPPQIVQEYARRFPGTTFIIMHACGSYALSAYEAIRDYPNVYFDLSYIVTKYKQSSVWLDLKYLTEVFDRRLIWGSDFPEVSAVTALKDFNELTQGLKKEKRDNILFKNFTDILSIA